MSVSGYALFFIAPLKQIYHVLPFQFQEMVKAFSIIIRISLPSTLYTHRGHCYEV